MLLQERLGHKDPWRICVICTLLTKTHASVARGRIEVFLDTWPTARSFYEDEDAAIRAGMLFETLGLASVRLNRLLSIAKLLVQGTDPLEIAGANSYLWHSLKIFVYDDLDVEPADPYLKQYVERKSHARKD